MTTEPIQVMREEVFDPLGMKNTGLDRLDLHETVPVSCRMGWDCGSTATDAAVATGDTRPR